MLSSIGTVLEPLSVIGAAIAARDQVFRDSGLDATYLRTKSPACRNPDMPMGISANVRCYRDSGAGVSLGTPVLAAICPSVPPSDLSSRAYSIFSAGWATGRPT
jgi:hypothetical protein